MGKKLHSEKAGWFIACLYNTSVYASIIAGVFILPDSPQMVFWCLSLLMILNITLNETKWLYWLLLGASVGFCILSKVHGVFIWIGLGLFIVIKKRSWLKKPQLYISVMISAAIASPILLWNISNNFVTYKYHSERVTVNNATIHFDGFIREFFGQILYNNPVNVIIIIIALVAWLKHKRLKSSALPIYSFIALPMAFILLILSLFRDTLPHWSGPAYVSLLPMAGVYLAESKSKTTYPAFLKTAIGIILFAIAGGLLLINFYPGTLGKTTLLNLGDGDLTLDMSGWKQAGDEFQNIYKNDVKNGVMPASADMICYKWFPAAHEDYYFCRPIGMQMIGLGSAFDLHEYIWYNNYRKNLGTYDKVYCVVPSNENYDPKVTYSGFYDHIDSITAIPGFRKGKLARSFYVYRLSGWKGIISVP